MLGCLQASDRLDNPQHADPPDKVPDQVHGPELVFSSTDYPLMYVVHLLLSPSRRVFLALADSGEGQVIETRFPWTIM